MSAETVPFAREEFEFVAGARRQHTLGAFGNPDGLDTAMEREPHLWIAPEPKQKTKRKASPMGAALALVGVLLAIFAAQLGLSIAVSQGAYEARALQLELRDLNRVERVLTQNVDKLASPQHLAENAAALGMVQNSTPATLRLSDGAILGSIDQRTTAVDANLIANATLENLPVVGADGLLVNRNLQQTVGVAAASATTPVPWEGMLPAPQTR